MELLLSTPYKNAYIRFSTCLVLKSIEVTFQFPRDFKEMVFQQKYFKSKLEREKYELKFTVKFGTHTGSRLNHNYGFLSLYHFTGSLCVDAVTMTN